MNQDEFTKMIMELIKENKLLFMDRDDRVRSIKDMRLFTQEDVVIFYEAEKK